MKTLIPLVMVAILSSCSGEVSFEKDGRDVALSEICDAPKTRAHIAAHPGRWQAAFDFLRDTDLGALAPGNYDILPAGEVFAIVSEYVPRPADSCRFESHRRYIDLQYLVAGTERMGVTGFDALAVGAGDVAALPFDGDIEFYSPDGARAAYATATPDVFFAFFPDDPHRPSMAPDDGSVAAPVRKVVVKIEY